MYISYVSILIIFLFIYANFKYYFHERYKRFINNIQDITNRF